MPFRPQIGLGIFNRMGSQLSLDSIFSNYSFTNMWSAENTSDYSTQNALTLNGTDEVVITDNVLTPLANTTVGTWSAWVKADDWSNGSNQRFITFGDTDANEWMSIGTNTTGFLVGVVIIGGTTQWIVQSDSSIDANNGQWVHIAMVQDGTTAAPELYVNGSKPAQSNTSSNDNSAWFSAATGLDNGRIGCRNRFSAGDNEHWGGSITDVLYINDALSGAEILDIYNNGVPKDESGRANVIAYYRFNNASDNYNSDVANEWNFYDEISGIQSETLNCEEADITAYNIAVELTAYDYAAEHDLSSSGYNAPTVNTSDANFGGKQSLTFTSANSQGLAKSVSNWRGSDNEGMMTFVYKGVGGVAQYCLNSSNEGVNTDYWGMCNLGTGDIIRNNGGGTLDRIGNVATSDFARAGVLVVTITGNGSTYTAFINGIEHHLNAVSGSLSGRWGNDISNRDNILIGLTKIASDFFGSMDWCMSGYHSSILSNANIVAMHQDFMTYYGMSIPLAMSQLDQLNGVVNGWNYNFLDVNGTTTTSFDLKGQYDMSNPAAGNQPTLNANNLEFDGISQYLYNGVANWRGGDATGVLHLFYKVDNANSDYPFSTSDEVSEANYLVFGNHSDGRLRIINTLSAGSEILETTDSYNTYKVVSYVQDGVQAKIYVDGVKITDYNTETLTTEWFNDGSTQDNISLGALIRLTPVYYQSNWKGAFYTAYVDDATVTAEATKILNSGL